LRLIKKLNHSEPSMKLGNEAEIIGRSADNPERFRGPNLSGQWLDEASQAEKEAFEIGLACLRQEGEQGWFSATFTPCGKQHWTYEVFGQTEEEGKPMRPNTALFKARTRDNPFLPAEFYETVKQQYSSALATRELEGEFTDPLIEFHGYASCSGLAAMIVSCCAPALRRAIVARRRAAANNNTTTAHPDFEAELWAAADLLRGNIESSEYKHVVLGLIFLKYVSDAFEERRAQLQKEQEEDPGVDLDEPDEYAAKGVFYLPEKARWSFLQANARQPTIGTLVDDAM
jgi:hypothetical protein